MTGQLGVTQAEIDVRKAHDEKRQDARGASAMSRIPVTRVTSSRTQTWLHNCVGEICVLVLPWLYDLFEPCDLVGQNLGSPAVAVERERGRGPLNSGPGLLARHGLGHRFPWSPERAGFR